MADTEKPKGPASYFSSIEKKYGFSIQPWLNLLKTQKAFKHMEMLAWLKSDHQMGHGHANALVAVFRSQEDL